MYLALSGQNASENLEVAVAQKKAQHAELLNRLLS